jgi:hypothetical protein
MKIVDVAESTGSRRANAAKNPNLPQPMHILKWGEVSETLLSPHVDDTLARGVEKPDGRANDVESSCSL